MTTTSRKKSYIQWHQKLVWLGGITLMLFAFSGLLHPVMVWTGPQAKAFYPPQVKLNATQLESLPRVLRENRIERAKMIKVIATREGPKLQITDPGERASNQERRYVSLDTGEELAGYDLKQAAWLAEYYTGLPSDQIANIELKTSFDNEYSWANRLLPVYRVAYKGNENLVAFVYTETNALASLSNDWKRSIQTLFGVLHTWNWLDDAETFRLVVMSALLLCVIALIATGIGLILTLKKRKIGNSDRRRHRQLAAYLLWLPLLGFSASGFYHLLQSSLSEHERGLRLGKDLDLSNTDWSGASHWVERYESVSFNGLSLVSKDKGQVMFRLSVPQGRPGKPISRNLRYDGSPIEKSALYIDPVSGEELAYSDAEHAEKLVSEFFDVDASQIIDRQLITRFGVHYDFRNKRLPVWMFTLDTELGDRVFIDPVTGVLVDRLIDSQRYEGYSFSFLHKWNFLRPLVGREVRDVILALLMLATLSLGILGIRLQLKRRSVTKRSPSAVQTHPETT